MHLENDKISSIMKKAFFILLAAIIVFTGCTKTEDETVPESVRASIRGNYYGNSGVSYVKTGIADTLYTYSKALVTNDKIQIEGVAVSAVVDSIFGRGTAAAQGILQKPVQVSYKLYNAKAANDEYFPMTYKASSISINVNKNGQTHTIGIDFYASNGTTGFFWYYPNKNRLDMTLVSSKISMDGKEVTHFASKPDTTMKVEFRFPLSLQKR